MSAMMKRGSVALMLGVVLCSGLFANDNIMDTYFEGDELNRRIRTYIVNVSNLIPDSTTLQNVWSCPPGTLFGIGVNGSITLLERKLASSVLDGVEGFGGNHLDLSQFPEAIPFLPGLAFDMRVGVKRMDVGFTGMWLDENILADNVGTTFLGDGSHFSYRAFGLDLRYALVQESKDSPLVPAVTLQGGYYFTWMGFGISAGDTEKVSVDFRNDSILLAVQVSKNLPIITPFLGMKAIFSKTDSGFIWETHRPVMVKGEPYPDGVRYKSGGTDGDYYSYFQVYGGLGIDFLFEHLITVGGAYNVMTNHFGINLAARLVFNF